MATSLYDFTVNGGGEDCGCEDSVLGGGLSALGGGSPVLGGGAGSVAMYIVVILALAAAAAVALYHFGYIKKASPGNNTSSVLGYEFSSSK